MTVESGSPQERLHSRDAYLAPTRECDVVMKGGITSGVLYPLAVCELASVYRLRNVGGTSAGAIAAAAAAAAEYGRTSEKPGSGFQGLAALPAWLGTDDHLVGLFRPPAVTRRLHGLLLRAVSPGASRLRLLGAVVWSGLRSGRWWLPVIGLLPGALLVLAVLAGDPGSWLSWLGALVAVALALGGLVVGAALAVVLNAGAALDANMYGIVSGSAAADGGDSLSDWLADQIDTLAGLEPGGPPLTFGDLWAGPEPRPDAGAGPVVNLEMLSTNITEGRPYRLPDDLGPALAFSEEEFARFFPQRVVAHLVQHASGPRTDEGLVPWPAARDLPVVVATRMSLSFPILISAVPLYAVDRSMQVGEEKRFERTWFSDGGITSNFPISFFDSLLPSRPTFGINLRSFHPRHPVSTDEHDNVWMPRTNRGGILEWWSRWNEGQGLTSLVGFVRAIADTMQNWVDNQQTRVPGYRDRIVHISHTDDEGGMNLAMPPEVLDRLTERGRCAGERLVDYYTTPPGVALPSDDQRVGAGGAEAPETRVVSWENHRWIRLRTSLALVSDAIDSLADRFDDAYADDLAARLDDAPSYPFKNLDQQALAQALMSGVSGPTGTAGSAGPDPRVRLSAGLRQLAQEIEAVEQRGANVPLDVGGPSPAPVLRIAPGGRPTDRRVASSESST